MTRAEAFIRSARHLTGCIAGLSAEDSLEVVAAMEANLARIRRSVEDRLARDAGRYGGVA